MITFLEIEQESARHGVSIETVEKDYHLDWYLAGLDLTHTFPEFMFYGGTAIKKLYLQTHRYSEDLDLVSEQTIPLLELQQRLVKVHDFLAKEANLFFSIREEESLAWGTQTRFFIHYRGFSETAGTKRFMLDFAQGIEALPKPSLRKLKTDYRDLKSQRIMIYGLPLEVICAEKLALIIDKKRQEPRDIYDLWAVLLRVKRFNWKILFSRLRYRLVKIPEHKVVASLLNHAEFKDAWEARLRHQVPDLPGYEVVRLELSHKLAEHWPT